MLPTKEKLFKVLLIGDAGVGKTSFVQRYTNDIFRVDYRGTVGVDFALKVSIQSRLRYYRAIQYCMASMVDT